jgi:putative spermidine/putrescine transport system ATP-binding protein
MQKPIVTFEKVTKSYDGRKDVVKDIDLGLNAGEFLTLLGPSGSGKTTILMMLAGFEEPTSGTITLNGEKLNNRPPHQRGIGVVFQNYALFPHMTVKENLSFPLEMQGIGRAEREKLILDSLDMVRLNNLGERKPSELSGGQQQRVALARALIFKPSLVLMDEPLGALDKQLREHMQLEIKHLHDQLGVTIVYVTHDQGEALTMSNRIAVLHQGKIQQLAAPTTIYDEPANSFVASFIGENNQLEAVVLESDAKSCKVRLASGIIIGAKASEQYDIGASIILSIRPERVKLGLATRAENQINAVVEECIYFGDHSKLRLSFEGAPSFMARSSYNDFSSAYTKGDVVSVSWDSHVCRALRAAS